MAVISTTGLLAALIVVLLPMASHGGASGGSAGLVAEPAPGSSGEQSNSLDCMAVLLEKLSPCAPYVEAGSNVAAPGKECCVGLAAVAAGAPQCLCLLMHAVDGEYGIMVDHARASELPGACKVAMPPPENMCPAEAAPSPSPGTPVACNHCNGVDPALGSPAPLALIAGVAFAAVSFF